MEFTTVTENGTAGDRRDTFGWWIRKFVGQNLVETRRQIRQLLGVSSEKFDRQTTSDRTDFSRDNRLLSCRYSDTNGCDVPIKTAPRSIKSALQYSHRVAMRWKLIARRSRYDSKRLNFPLYRKFPSLPY
jgi:hypothetical protein